MSAKDKEIAAAGGMSNFSNITGEQLEGSDDEDDDDEEGGAGGKSRGKISKKKKAGGSGRRRIDIKFIENKSRRQVTFSRRKRGLMKKAYELTTLTGTQALVLIASETGHVYTFATPKLQPVVTLREGKELIQSCLNAPDTNYPSDLLAATAAGNGGSSAQQANPGGGKAAGESPPSSPIPQPQSPSSQQSQNVLHHPNEAYMYGGQHTVGSVHQASPFGHGMPHAIQGFPHEVYGGTTGLPTMGMGHSPMNPPHMGK